MHDIDKLKSRLAAFRAELEVHLVVSIRYVGQDPESAFNS
jgi:hypothetical protein